MSASRRRARSSCRGRPPDWPSCRRREAGVPGRAAVRARDHDAGRRGAGRVARPAGRRSRTATRRTPPRRGTRSPPGWRERRPSRTGGRLRSRRARGGRDPSVGPRCGGPAVRTARECGGRPPRLPPARPRSSPSVPHHSPGKGTQTGFFEKVPTPHFSQGRTVLAAPRGQSWSPLLGVDAVESTPACSLKLAPRCIGQNSLSFFGRVLARPKS